MFLALKEIKKEKLRSGAIITMIVLICYLIFILTSLSLGLARQNTAAIKSWHVQRFALNSNANTDMRQSFLNDDQLGQLTNNEAVLGQGSVVAKAAGKEKLSAVFVGLKSNQFIAKNLQLTSGHPVRHAHEVVVDDAFHDKGYRLGSHLRLNDQKQRYTIVGFTKNAKLNIAPIVYGQLSTWKTMRGFEHGPSASAIVSKKASYRAQTAGVTTYSTKQIINKLPGYQAQNTTFILMIAFLMVISLIIIAVFLYILTMQKMPNYAVLRAQGIPSKVLVNATISQSVLLVIFGLVIGSLLTAGTAFAMPAAVPMAFDVPMLAVVGLGLVLMALLGSLVPVRSVLRVDPVSVIGG